MKVDQVVAQLGKLSSRDVDVTLLYSTSELMYTTVYIRITFIALGGSW